MSGHMPTSGGKKDLNFELNLLPVFDILSVCICFLLMTVVWVQVGALKASQGVGAQSQAETKPSTSIWITMEPNQDVQLVVKSSNRVDGQMKIAGHGGQLDWNALASQIQSSFQRYQISQAVVIPSQNTRYEDVVAMMDRVRGIGIQDVGLTPL